MWFTAGAAARSLQPRPQAQRPPNSAGQWHHLDLGRIDGAPHVCATQMCATLAVSCSCSLLWGLAKGPSKSGPRISAGLNSTLSQGLGKGRSKVARQSHARRSDRGHHGSERTCRLAACSPSVQNLTVRRGTAGALRRLRGRSAAGVSARCCRGALRRPATGNHCLPLCTCL